MHLRPLRGPALLSPSLCDTPQRQGGVGGQGWEGRCVLVMLRWVPEHHFLHAKSSFGVKKPWFFQVSGISRMDKIRHGKALPFPMERTCQLFVLFGKIRIILFIRFS